MSTPAFFLSFGPNSAGCREEERSIELPVIKESPLLSGTIAVGNNEEAPVLLGETAMTSSDKGSKQLLVEIVDKQSSTGDADSEKPFVYLLPHAHTLFCERKQRVCTAVGKLQELEVLKVEGISESSISRGCWIRLTNVDDSSTFSVDNYELIPDTQGQDQYTLKSDEIGKFLGFRYVSKDSAGTSAVNEEKGEFRLTSTANIVNQNIDTDINSNDKDCEVYEFSAGVIGPVLPGPPRLLDIEIVGERIVGATVFAKSQYIGGREGDSEYWWLKVNSDGDRVNLTQPRKIQSSTIEGARNHESYQNDPRYYTIKQDDLNCQLKVKCRPVRVDGCEGEVFTSKSSGIVGNS